jgi:hypothetical protein
VNGRHSSDQDTAAADEREKTSGSQKIMLDKRKLARNVPDNSSTFSVTFQRTKIAGSASTSVLANNS